MNNPKWLDFVGIELFPRDHKQYPWAVLNDTTHTIVNLCPGHFLTSNRMNYEKTTSFYSEYDTTYRGVYESFDLYRYDLASGDVARLTDAGTGDTTIMCGLSPDDSQLYYGQTRKQRSEAGLWRVQGRHGLGRADRAPRVSQAAHRIAGSDQHHAGELRQVVGEGAV